MDADPYPIMDQCAAQMQHCRNLIAENRQEMQLYQDYIRSLELCLLEQNARELYMKGQIDRRNATLIEQRNEFYEQLLALKTLVTEHDVDQRLHSQQLYGTSLRDYAADHRPTLQRKGSLLTFTGDGRIEAAEWNRLLQEARAKLDNRSKTFELQMNLMKEELQTTKQQSASLAELVDRYQKQQKDLRDQIRALKAEKLAVEAKMAELVQTLQTRIRLLEERLENSISSATVSKALQQGDINMRSQISVLNRAHDELEKKHSNYIRAMKEAFELEKRQWKQKEEQLAASYSTQMLLAEQNIRQKQPSKPSARRIGNEHMLKASIPDPNTMGLFKSNSLIPISTSPTPKQEDIRSYKNSEHPEVDKKLPREEIGGSNQTSEITDQKDPMMPKPSYSSSARFLSRHRRCQSDGDSAKDQTGQKLLIDYSARHSDPEGFLNQDGNTLQIYDQQKPLLSSDCIKNDDVTNQNDTNQIDTNQIDTNQIDTNQIDTNQIDTNQIYRNSSDTIEKLTEEEILPNIDLDDGNQLETRSVNCVGNTSQPTKNEAGFDPHILQILEAPSDPKDAPNANQDTFSEHTYAVDRNHRLDTVRDAHNHQHLALGIKDSHARSPAKVLFDATEAPVDLKQSANLSTLSTPFSGGILSNRVPTVSNMDYTDNASEDNDTRRRSEVIWDLVLTNSRAIQCGMDDISFSTITVNSKVTDEAKHRRAIHNWKSMYQFILLQLESQQIKNDRQLHSAKRRRNRNDLVSPRSQIATGSQYTNNTPRSMKIIFDDDPDRPIYRVMAYSLK